MISGISMDRQVGDEYPCACGCGNKIVVTQQHVYGFKRMNYWPKYIKGHILNVIRKPKKKYPYEIGHTYPCACGCGELVEITERHVNINHVPKFIGKHQYRVRKKRLAACRIIYNVAKENYYDDESLFKNPEFLKEEMGLSCKRIEEGKVNPPDPDRDMEVVKRISVCYNRGCKLSYSDEFWYATKLIEVIGKELIPIKVIKIRLRECNLPFISNLFKDLRVHGIIKEGKIGRGFNHYSISEDIDTSGIDKLKEILQWMERK